MAEKTRYKRKKRKYFFTITMIWDLYISAFLGGEGGIIQVDI